MTFGQEILVWCIVCPILISAASCLVARVIGSRRPESRLSSIVVACGWWVAVTAALTARQGWQWWPEDAWRQAVWPLFAWSVLISGAGTQPLSRPRAWVIAGVLASATALVAMPVGDAWSDTYPLHRVWMCAIATSCLLNGFAIRHMAESGAGRWVLLVALAAPAGSLLMAGGAYASLAEWAMAIILATFTVAVWGMFPSSINHWVIAFPVVAAAASVTAAARFYTYDSISPWVYVAVLYGPALVAIVDTFATRGPAWLRVVISGIVSLALLGACTWAVQLV